MAVGSSSFGSLVPGWPYAEDEAIEETEETEEERLERASSSDRDPRQKTETKEIRGDDD